MKITKREPLLLTYYDIVEHLEVPEELAKQVTEELTPCGQYKSEKLYALTEVKEYLNDRIRSGE